MRRVLGAGAQVHWIKTKSQSGLPMRAVVFFLHLVHGLSTVEIDLVCKFGDRRGCAVQVHQTHSRHAGIDRSQMDMDNHSPE